MVSKRSPSRRTYDTPLGQIMGYLQHEIVYWQWEIEAAKWLAYIPTWFPLNVLHDAINGIFQAAYDTIYQRAYNEGAKKGNEMNSEILGWVDKARTDLTSKVNSVKSELDRTLSSVKTDVAAAKRKVSDLNASLNEVAVDLSGLKTTISSLNSSVVNVRGRVSSLDTEVSQMLSKVRSHTLSIDNLKLRMKRLEDKLAVEAIPEEKEEKEKGFWEWLGL